MTYLIKYKNKVQEFIHVYVADGVRIIGDVEAKKIQVSGLTPLSAGM